MQTSFDVIERTVDEALAHETKSPKLKPQALDYVRQVATHRIAGFEIHDPETETALCDRLITLRRKDIAAFQAHRKDIRAILKDRGVIPLAVVPTSAWAEICRASGLFRLFPDQAGVVNIANTAFDIFKDVSYPADKIAEFVKRDYRAFLLRLFPDYQEPETGKVAVHLALPPPPADVAATLLKVKDADLGLVVQAEALGFQETPVQMFQNKQAADAAEQVNMPHWQKAGYSSYEEWRIKCPIITSAHGTATAVLAQFGPFPIEQEVVERVVNGDKLLADLSPIDEITFPVDSSETFAQAFMKRLDELARKSH